MFSCHYWGVHLLYLGMPCMLWYICLIFLYDLIFSCTLAFTIVSPCISWYTPLRILVYCHCYSGTTPIHSGTLRYALYTLVHMSHVLVFSCTLAFTLVSPCISWYTPLCILVYRHCYSGTTLVHSGTLSYALYPLVHMSHILVRFLYSLVHRLCSVMIRVTALST